MQYTTLGRTGMQVSRLAMGCMRLPMLDEDTQEIDRAEAVPLIRHALAGGINFFDSAMTYNNGDSEKVLGEALEDVPRDQVVIQTKVPISWARKPPTDTFETRLDRTLKRLRTDYIDQYLYHALTVAHLEEHGDEAWQTVLKARDDGRIRHLGLSSHDEPENVIKLIDTGLFESILMQYNLLDVKYAACFAHARAKGMGTMVMGPVGGGRLATPNVMTELVPGADRTAEACLRFVWSNPDIDVALSGMSDSAQLKENLQTAATCTPLSEAERADVDAEIQKRKALADLYCTGCNYCMPCPNGVSISNCFLMMNWLKVYGLEEPARSRYKGMMASGKDASQCIECGECEEKCPQKIPIREQLKATHAALAS